MTREQIIESIRAASIDGKLTCEKAHALASELKVPLKEVGALCNDLKIKVAACQLGCF